MSESRFPWRTLLFVSVALNLLVIGGVAGAFGAGVRLERGESEEAAVERMPAPRAFLRALPPETRAAMRQELAKSWQTSRETRQAAAQARRDAYAALAQEPYDATQVRAAFARLRAADETAIGAFHDNMIAAFGELTPEQRREAVAALRGAGRGARQGAAAPDRDAVDPAALSPEQRQDVQERRQERRERWRERREERMRQRQAPQP